MITKAIVEQIIDSSSVNVRIPVLDKIEDASTGVPLGSCQIAHICSLPNIEYNFNIGDIVFVDFEDNNMDNPVIIGYLYGVSDSKVDGTVESILVRSCAKLPSSIQIGEVTEDELSCLVGIKTNIQNSINLLKNNNFSSTVNKNNVYIDSEEQNKESVESIISLIGSNKSIIDDEISHFSEEAVIVEKNLEVVTKKIGKVDGSISEMIDELEKKVSQLEESYSNGYFV